MAKIKLTGVIVDNDTAKVYQWFGFDAISAKSIDRAIKALEDGEELEIDLNSPGGYCNVGAEIYTMLRQARTDGHSVIVNVVGEACSAATVLMCGADEVRASDVAMFMFHNASVTASGKARDMRSATECLEQTDESIVNAYEKKTGKTREELHDLIDAETWMSAQRAMEYGFVDGMMFEEEEEDPDKALELFGQVSNRVEQTMKRVASSNGLIPQDKLEVMRDAMMNEIMKNEKVAPVQQTKEDGNSNAVNINTKLGGKKMTLQEAYQEHPELENAPKNVSRRFSFPLGILSQKGVKKMSMKALAITMGIGAAAGAVAIMMVPRTNPVRKLANKAACKVEDAAYKVTDKVNRTMDQMM